MHKCIATLTMAEEQHEQQRPPIMDASQFVVPGSSLLSRVSSFLPAIRAANETLRAEDQGAVDLHLRSVEDNEENDSSCTTSNGDEESSDDDESTESSSGDESGDETKSANNNNPTIVMDLQLGSLQDNPAMALLAEKDMSDDSEREEEQEQSASAVGVAVRRLLDAKLPPKKKAKGPLITEILP